MTKIVLGVELIPSLDQINPVLHALTPVQQQQVIEMLLVTYLYRASQSQKIRGLLMDGFVKHVWQLLDQADANRGDPL